jgi:pimeloyl-ACP methyl ester carboxylesterase
VLDINSAARFESGKRTSTLRKKPKQRYVNMDTIVRIFRAGGLAGSLAALAIAGLLVAESVGPARAGEVVLKNQLVISGSPRRLASLVQEPGRMRDNETPSFPFVMIENGYQRIFIPKGQAQRIDDRDELSKFETFTLKQHKTGLKRAAGALVETSPFNEFGQRTHTLETEQGRRELVVGVTKINPKYVAITGLNCQWDYGIATPSVAPEQLALMIKKANDPKNPDHRFATARFYLQAGLYEEAGKELESIAKDFPELSKRVADARKELQDYEHRLILQELARRKAAGQHELAHSYALGVPQNEASATVLHDVQEMIRDYDTAHEKMAKVRVLLSDLQAKLADQKQVSAVMPLRGVVEDQLTIESLDRLQAFFNLVDDASLRPAEKLALAYSGWVVGSASAVTDLSLAIRMWDAQHAILEYLRAENPQDRRDRLAEITAMDGIGTEMVIKLIRCLPPVVMTPDIRTGVATVLQVAGRTSEELPSYGALIPPEYDFRHQYPMVVTLHAAGHSLKGMLDWWGGTPSKPGLALRRGYIVIAPEYAEAGATKYTYSVAAHDAVLRAVADARKRFNVDSDRIFLSGHGMGGDAAFDIGMSHPDLFAGVIPINGICDQFCKWYTDNAAYTSWYVVTGEFDGRDTFGNDSALLGRMMRKNADVVLVEFIQRGHEPYFEEAPRIYDWMDAQRRRKPPREFTMKVLRPSESRFYWLRADGLPESVLESTVLAGPSRGPIRPMSLGAKITAANSIWLTSGAKSHTVWLNPDLINFEQRVTVRLRGSQKFHNFVKPSIEAILEDYRLRADKQTLYTARLDLD